MAAAVALVLGAGVVLATVNGTAARPARVRPAVPDVVPPSSVPAPPSESDGREAVPERADGGTPEPRRPRAVVPSRTRAAVSGRPRSRPVRRPKARSRPRVPPWVRAQCARRFPDDPRRRSACVAVLSGRFGG